MTKKSQEFLIERKNGDQLLQIENRLLFAIAKRTKLDTIASQWIASFRQQDFMEMKLFFALSVQIKEERKKGNFPRPKSA